MKPISIECMWSPVIPNLFTREVVITLPYPLRFTGESDAGKTDVDETIVLDMRTVGGKRGKVLKRIPDDMNGSEAYDLIKEMYSFSDLEKVRFAGECLTPECFLFIRAFSLRAIDDDFTPQITIESTMLRENSWKQFTKLQKGDMALVDNMRLVVKIPGEEKEFFDDDMKKVVDALSGCIYATREQMLRLVNLTIIIDRETSMDLVDRFLYAVKNECMEDDEEKERIGVEGIALNSFAVAVVPESDDENVNELTSTVIERLHNNLFEMNKVIVMPLDRA